MRCAAAWISHSAGQRQHRAFHACVVPPVVRVWELGEPQTFTVLDDVLRPGAAHRRTGMQQFEQLLRNVLCASLLLLEEGFGGGEQRFELHDLVEFA